MLVECERWVGDKDRLLFWPKFFLAHSSTASSSWLVLLNRGSLRAQSPLFAAGSHSGILSSTDSNLPEHLVILLSYVHLLPPFFSLFTQVHLLIDGSVKGQYITYESNLYSFRWGSRCFLMVVRAIPLNQALNSIAETKQNLD